MKKRRPSKIDLGKIPVVRRLWLGKNLLLVNVYPRGGVIRPVVLRVLRKVVKHRETLEEAFLRLDPKKLSTIVLWYDEQTVRSQDTPWGRAARSWHFDTHPFMGEIYEAGDWAPGTDLLTVMVVPRWVVVKQRDRIDEYSEAVFAFLVHELVHGFLGVRSERRTEQIVDDILRNIERRRGGEKGRRRGRAPLRRRRR